MQEVRPPVVVAAGAAMGAVGGLVAAHFSARATTGCASVGISAAGRAAHAFVPACLDPGLALVGGLAVAIGGAVLLLWGLWAMGRSWLQRGRARHPDVLPARPPAAHAPAEAPVPVAALSPPAGWYPVAPGRRPMWWDGRAWAAAPTLPPVPQAAGSRS